MAPVRLETRLNESRRVRDRTLREAQYFINLKSLKKTVGVSSIFPVELKFYKFLSAYFPRILVKF